MTAPPELRLARIMQRDGLTEERAKNRMSAQHGEDYYISRSDFVISNEDDPDDLELQVSGILQQLQAGEISS